MNKKHYHFHNIMKVKSKTGQKFRKFRKSREITMNHLKAKTNIDKSYISNFERGEKNMPDDTLYILLTKGMDLRPSEAEKIIQRWRIEDRVELLSPEDKLDLMENLFNEFMKEEYELIPKKAIADMKYINEYLDQKKKDE